jgi:phage tail-like protein
MASNSNGQRDDPYAAYNFLITLIDSSSSSTTTQQGAAVAGFSECSGLEVSMQTEDYQEGGNNNTTLKFSKHIAYTNIRLKRGMTTSDDLWQWLNDFIDGNGKRKDGTITLRDELQQAVKSWQFTRGLPVKWTGPTLNAAQSQLAFQELEIAHEGLRMVPPATTAN